VVTGGGSEEEKNNKGKREIESKDRGKMRGEDIAAGSPEEGEEEDVSGATGWVGKPY